MKIFKEFYYWMYWYSRIVKSNTDKEKADSAYLLISLLQSMNIWSAFAIVNYFFRIVLARNTIIFLGLLVAAILGVINHFYLFTSREEIFKKYEYLTPQRRKKGKMLFWLYVIVSIYLLFYLGSKLVTHRY
jgi:magnesium-transporting ATPase (P-type)